MDIAIAIMIGLALSAACGLRVFVPLLVLSIAAKVGVLALGTSLGWIGSTEAIIAFSVATVLEIAAYKVPWLDHALDTVASPAAVMAGTIVSASQIGAISGISPLMQWSCAIIVGGGIAGLMQTGSVSTRAASTVVTAGIANPFISVIQSVLAVVMSVLAVLVPVLAVLMAVAMLCGAGVVVFWIARLRRSRRVATVAVVSARTA